MLDYFGNRNSLMHKYFENSEVDICWSTLMSICSTQTHFLRLPSLKFLSIDLKIFGSVNVIEVQFSVVQNTEEVNSTVKMVCQNVTHNCNTSNRLRTDLILYSYVDHLMYTNILILWKNFIMVVLTFYTLHLTHCSNMIISKKSPIANFFHCIVQVVFYLLSYHWIYYVRLILY